MGGSSDAKKLYDLYELEANCLSEERFGNERFASFGDGPKFVCGIDFIAHKNKATNKTCLVYSIGSNNDISFEKSVSMVVRFTPSIPPSELKTLLEVTLPRSMNGA